MTSTSSDANRPRTRGGAKSTPEKQGSGAASVGGTPRKTRARRAARNGRGGDGSDDNSDSSDESIVCEDVSLAVNGKKNAVRGKAWRTKAGDYLRYHCIDDGCLYQPGDAAYIESQGADQPFFICIIQEFRRSKRDTLMVNIKWFYRPCEVPETVYQLLVQDRNTEHSAKVAIINDPLVKARELFISDATDTYPVSLLRGVCRVQHFADIHAAHDFHPVKDNFFYILGYNPETRRLASTQGEIRVGPSHQARLPELRSSLPADKRPERCENWEEPRWVPPPNAPGARDGDLLMYLRAARSMAAFAGLCDGGSPDDGCVAASRDDTTINAMDVLHNSGYDPGKALQALVKCPVPKGIEKKWSEDETKRFVKGLRQYGKNFFRIRKDLLSHKETADLVEFYYLWKKTPAASNQRPHRRRHRQSVLRRIKTTRTTRTAKEDPGDLSSASEDDNSDEDSDTKDLSGYHCRHCLSTSSKDWHHAGKDKTLLCTDCRLHFKKYAELPPLRPAANQTNEEEAPYMFRPVQNTDDEDADGRIRTRTRTKEINARNRSKQDSAGNSPDPESETKNRKSPVSSSSSSSSTTSSNSGDIDKDKAKSKSMVESPGKGLKRRHAGEQQQDNEDERQSADKKPKNDIQSPVDSVSSQTSSFEENGIDAEPENDVEKSNTLPVSSTETSKAEAAVAETSPLTTAPPLMSVVKPTPEAEFKIKADLLPMVKLEPDFISAPPPPDEAQRLLAPVEDKLRPLVVPEERAFPLVPQEEKYRPLVVPEEKLCPIPPPEEAKLLPKEEKLNHRPLTPPSVALDMSLPPTEPPAVPPPSLGNAPPLLSPHSAFLPPAAHSAFARPFAIHPPPAAEIFPPREALAEQSEPHDLKIKQEVQEIEIKKEPVTQAPSPRLAEKSVIVASPSSAIRKTGPSPTPSNRPSATPPLLPYQSPLAQPQHPFGLAPPNMPLSYPQSGPMNPYSPYGYPYPFSYYPPHLRMMTPSTTALSPSGPSNIFTDTAAGNRATPSRNMDPPLSTVPKSSPSPRGGSTTHPLFSPHQMSGPQFAVPISPALGSMPTPEMKKEPVPEKPTLINLAEPNEENGDDDEDVPSPAGPALPRGPSPEPRIEDSECHRSQSAIFLRHWNRGEGNSCTRTDLTFKPVPDSKLARKREERLRRQAERERDEREKEKERERAAAQARKASTPDRRETPKPSTSGSGPIESITSPGFDRFVPRSYPDTPALRQLSEYARPHTGFSPGGPPRSTVASVLGLTSPAMDPMLHYQLASMYGPGARERLELELEREKREREYRELREREITDRLKEEMIKNGTMNPMGLPGGPRLPSGPIDPHWLEIQRRLAGIPGGFPGGPGGSGFGPAGAPPPGFGLYSMPGAPNPAALTQLERERMERMGLQVPGSLGGPPSSGGGPSNEQLTMERFALAADPMLRLQMADSHTHAHTHAHAHTHTHLHLHPGQENASQGPPGFSLGGPPPPGAFHRPPGFLGPENPLGLHPALMGRPYDEQLARQLTAHVAAEQFQRQMLERFPHPAGPGGPPQGPSSLHPLAHPTLVAQHEEFIRHQQREREMKVRALEEAARGGRP